MNRREINKAGLPGLYSTILATAGPEICEALEVGAAHPSHNIHTALSLWRCVCPMAGMVYCWACLLTPPRSEVPSPSFYLI